MPQALFAQAEPPILAPYRSEEEAIAALLEAGAVLDVITPPPAPGRPVRK